MLDTFYSRYGLNVNSESTTWSACKRYDYFRRKFNEKEILEQALTFALELKNHLILTMDVPSLKNAISFALTSFKDEVKNLELSIIRNFFECTDDFMLEPGSIPSEKDEEPRFAGTLLVHQEGNRRTANNYRIDANRPSLYYS